ncbi:MAG TPA: hypothetical protein DEP51_05650 [Clostridiales bacterium]|nr:hypothetical protein [Clostridiales bacterium]
MENKEVLLEHQKKYILNFCNSIWGKIFFPISNEIKKSIKIHFEDLDDKLEHNKRIIKRINSITLKNQSNYYILKLKQIIFEINNKKTLNIKKREIPRNDYLAVVCIVKNESRYIKEWIDYYLLMGVDRIYLLDNESTDNLKEVIREYIDKEKIIYIALPREKSSNKRV